MVFNIILLYPAAIAVSRDHKPDQTDERQRIEDAGGFVMWAGKDYYCFKISHEMAHECVLDDGDCNNRNLESWRCSRCFSCIW